MGKTGEDNFTSMPQAAFRPLELVSQLGQIATTGHYARLQKRLQRKGTRSATRKLVATSGRERRLKRNTNYVLSRRIIAAHPNSLIGLEDLTGIRERSKRRKKRQNGKQLVAGLGEGPQGQPAGRGFKSHRRLQGLRSLKSSV